MIFRVRVAASSCFFFSALAPEFLFVPQRRTVLLPSAGTRDLHAAFDFFRGHHHFELAIIALATSASALRFRAAML